MGSPLRVRVLNEAPGVTVATTAAAAAAVVREKKGGKWR